MLAKKISAILGAGGLISMLWLMQLNANVEGYADNVNNMLSPRLETEVESKSTTSTTIVNSTENNSIVQNEPILEPIFNFDKYSGVKDIVEQEAYAINLDLVVAMALIDAESSFRANARNNNRNKSFDSGPAQLNNNGEPLLFYLGKTITLADGRTERVNRQNYISDARLNIAIGLKRFKYYLSLVDNDPFGGYAIHNIGMSITKHVRGKNGAVEVITAVRKVGNTQGANNLKNNFCVKYEKWRRHYANGGL